MNARLRTSLALVAAAAVLGALASPAAAAPPKRTTAPVILSGPTSPTAATTATFTFSSSTPGAVFTCQLDAGTAAPCVSGVSYSGIASGTHTFSVKAQAPGARVSGTTSATWTADSVAPKAPTVTGLSGLTNKTTSVVTFSSASADVVRYRCSLDGAAASTCASGLTVTAAAEGGHTFSVVAVDAVGNPSAPTTIGWSVDTNVSKPFVLSGPATLTSAAEATFAFIAADADATMECRLDGGAWTACTSPKTYSTVSVATHAFQVRATDRVGNVATSDTYTWKRGSTPITFQWTSPGALPSGITNAASATFDFSISGATTVECAFDGGAVIPSCVTPVTRGDLAEGLHTFAITVDKGLATQTKFSYTWLVDRTAPAAPSITAPTGWVASTSADVIVTSASAGDQLNCTVDGTASACSTGTTMSLTGLAQGGHSVIASASDKAGNVSISSASWNVDSLAPVLTVTTPTTLTGAVTVLSDDQLAGATDNPVLRTAAGEVVPVVRSCATVEGVGVDCSAQPRRISLTPASPLVPGESYVVAVNESGTSLTDLAGNPAPTAATPFRAPLVVQENSPAVVQTWRKVSASGAKGGSYLMDSRTGARVTWSFTGTSFTVHPVSGPGFGYVAVYVDGVRKGLFNQYSSSLKFTSARTIKGLSNAAHTVQVVVVGKKGAVKATGAAVGVDAFTVGGAVQKTPAVTQAWQRAKSTSALALYRSVASQKGQATSMTFTGTGIVWTFQKAADRGKAAVYVDGVLKATVDQYSSTSVARATYALTLASGRHTIRIVALGTKRVGAKGTLVSVDALTVR